MPRVKFRNVEGELRIFFLVPNWDTGTDVRFDCRRFSHTDVKT